MAAVAKIRRPDLRRLYERQLQDVTPGQFEFRLDLIRGADVLRLDPVTTGFTWDDENTGMTGTLTLQRPSPQDFRSAPVGRGHRVRCRVRWADVWYEVWEMVCRAPSVSKGDGTITVPLEDDLVRLRRNRREWSFRNTKARKKGWFPHEIAVEVARREGLVLGQVAKGKFRINKLVLKNGSALDVLKLAYKHERQKTGRRFVIRFRDGKLEIVPYRRNAILYVFRDQIQDALLDPDEPTGGLVTVIEAHGRTGKGSDAKKITWTLHNPRLVRRYGYLHLKRDFGHVESLADLKELARRLLHRRIDLRQKATLTIPGVPFIRRGDTARWITDEPGWHGPSMRSLDRSFVFVTGVSHSVDPTGYTCDVTIGQNDPYVKDQERQDEEARQRARDRRKG